MIQKSFEIFKIFKTYKLMFKYLISKIICSKNEEISPEGNRPRFFKPANSSQNFYQSLR